MPDDLQSIIGPLKVPDEVKDQVWNHFHEAQDQTDFTKRFNALPIPDETKDALWQLKFNRPESVPRISISPEAQKVYGKGELPPNLPQIAGRKALEYLPATAATVGTMLMPEAGPLPAITAATVFGGLGSAAQQGIEKAAGLPGAPKSLGEFQERATGEGVLQGAAETGGRFINAALGRIFGRYLNPEQLYQSALKPPPGQGAEQISKIVQGGLKERIPVDPEHWETNWQKLNDQVNQIIQTKPGAPIDPKAIASRLDQLKADWASGSGDPAFVNTIDKVQKDFESRWRRPMTTDEAQEVKKQIYKEIRKSKENYYTATESGIALDAKAELARGLMQELEQRYPEISALNKREGALIDLEKALTRFSAREGNKTVTSFFAPVIAGGFLGHGGPAGIGGAIGVTGAALVRSALEDPLVKSQLAIILNRARQTTAGKIAKVAAPYIPAGGIRLMAPGITPPPEQ
jgi:hypothetical protein